MDGFREGFGMYKSVGGRKYEGNYKYGKKNGYGVLTESNGDFYEGEFIDGRRVGLGKFRIRKEDG